MDPKISVVIPVYNGEKFVEHALQSVFSQTYQPFEVIVVDDGSTDRTSEILARYGGRIKVFKTRNSGGCSVPRNLGISAAKGDYIALLDVDDIWFRRKLELQAQVLRQYPKVDLVCSDFYTRHDKLRLLRQFGGLRYAQEINAGDLVFSRPFDAFSLLITRNFIGCPSTVVFSRTLIEKVGYFNDKFYSAEDYEFWFRCARETQFVCLPEALVYKRRHEGAMTINKVRILRWKKEVLEQMLRDNAEYLDQRGLLQKARYSIAMNNMSLARNISRRRIGEILVLYVEAFVVFPSAISIRGAWTAAVHKFQRLLKSHIALGH